MKKTSLFRTLNFAIAFCGCGLCVIVICCGALWFIKKQAIVGSSVLFRSECWIVKEVYSTVEFESVRDAAHNSKNIWIPTSGSSPIGHK